MEHGLTRRSIMRTGGLITAAAATGSLVPPGAAAVPRGPRAAAAADPIARFWPGADWRDTSGNLIEAHSGHIHRTGGRFYWIGADWSGGWGYRGFNIYQSDSLQSWSFVANVLPPSAKMPSSWEIARPKVLWNAATQRYVMWFKMKLYSAPGNNVHHGVATAPSITGPWTFQRDFYPGDYNTADSYLFQDDDGAAYFICSSPQRLNGPYDRRTLIFRLTDDFLDVRTPLTLVGPRDGREAPVLLKREGVYYLMTSGSSGWTHNQATYRTASALGGPWSAPVNLGSPTTHDSQPEFVLPVTGDSHTTYLYSGGRHVARRLQDSRYVWLPLRFWSDGSMHLDWFDSWSINLRTGYWGS